MRRLGGTMLALGGCWWVAGAAHAQDAESAPGPDLDFLEYLGAWAGDDDEWLAIEEWQKGNREGGDASDKEGRDKQRNDDDESE
jgi:hypothetical protein